MRDASAHTTTKNVVSEPRSAATVFGSCERDAVPNTSVSNPPDPTSCAPLYCVRRKNVLGSTPPGGVDGLGRDGERRGDRPGDDRADAKVHDAAGRAGENGAEGRECVERRAADAIEEDVREDEVSEETTEAPEQLRAEVHMALR